MRSAIWQSPEVVAASAVAGYISALQRHGTAQPSARTSRICRQDGDRGRDGQHSARLSREGAGSTGFCPADNLNTDGIYGKDYTYRDDMTPEMMAKVVMENYDPKFAGARTAATCSWAASISAPVRAASRRSTSLKAKGIPLVIAGSFSQTYLRNAFNNGFLCIEVPAARESRARVVRAE